MATTLQNGSDFNKLWFGQTVSNLGDRISRIALPTIAVLNLHGGALQVGIIAALGSLPFLLLSPFAGVWADRLSKRTLMIVADIGRLIMLSLVPLGYELHFLSLTLLYVVAAVVGTLSVFFQLAYQSYLPGLVGVEGIGEGNQKLMVSSAGANVVGAGIGGVLMQALGNALAVVVDAASFVVSLGGLLAIKHREVKPEPAVHGDGSVLGEMREGFRALGSDVRLRYLMLTTTVVNLAAAVASSLMIVYAYDAAKLNQGEVGATFAIGAVGLTLGGIFARKISAKLTIAGTLIVCVFTIGVAILIVPAAGAAHGLAALIVCQFLIGGASSTFGVNVMSLVQTITPKHMLGRINGTALSVIWGTATLGGLGSAALGATIGLRAGLVVAGLAAIAAASLVVFTPLRAVREMPKPPANAGDSETGEHGEQVEPSLEPIGARSVSES